ncbi:TetR/AcrR family transcriptional regulator [Acutalibacter sp. JLR.KK004]|uniref:TetR/AcrR family transcriptional regulator n=1 Tax=Acutalibacter sp. JLR.KK004 TaxID=3112622 RepID=UPI002FEF0F43
MPKSYSEQEREYIRKRLKEEAAKCLARYGVRRTTVDEIVKRVNIPKGTFYLFYKSKELLLFEVIQEQQENVNRKLYQTISGIASTELSAEKLTDVIFEFYKMTEEMLILKLIDVNEVELLATMVTPPKKGEDRPMQRPIPKLQWEGTGLTRHCLSYPRSFWQTVSRPSHCGVRFAQVEKRTTPHTRVTKQAESMVGSGGRRLKPFLIRETFK